MKLLVVLTLVVIVAIAAFAWVKLKAGETSSGEPPKAREPLTKNEQPMYFRLRETFPDDVVLAQVAFSALLTAKSRASRNTFDRKVADFVLCSKGFTVKAVIELDDSSHREKKEADAARDRLLSDAGYKVLRFKRVPDSTELRKALE